MGKRKVSQISKEIQHGSTNPVQREVKVGQAQQASGHATFQTFCYIFQEILHPTTMWREYIYIYTTS